MLPTCQVSTSKLPTCQISTANLPTWHFSTAKLLLSSTDMQLPACQFSTVKPPSCQFSTANYLHASFWCHWEQEIKFLDYSEVWLQYLAIPSTKPALLWRWKPTHSTWHFTVSLEKWTLNVNAELSKNCKFNIWKWYAFVYKTGEMKTNTSNKTFYSESRKVSSKC